MYLLYWELWMSERKIALEQGIYRLKHMRLVTINSLLKQRHTEVHGNKQCWTLVLLLPVSLLFELASVPVRA